MKKIGIFLLILMLQTLQAQDKPKNTYFQFELATPIRGNQTYIDNTGQSESQFTPDGISGRIGIGKHYHHWVGLSAHTGIEWIAAPKVVSIPLYANLHLSPKIFDETQITLQLGYGHSYSIGKQRNSGSYSKIRLGLQNSDNYLIFAEVNLYGYKSSTSVDNLNNISFGIALLTF